LAILHFNPEHIINKIKIYNKWLSIFPTVGELKNFKLTEELIDGIFKEFTFSSIKKTSNKNAILKSAFNVFFNKNIILSCPDNQKHTQYIIPDHIHELYLFGLKSLKAIQPKKIHNDDLFIDENNIQNSLLDRDLPIW
jgi:hypothetical protein